MEGRKVERKEEKQTGKNIFSSYKRIIFIPRTVAEYQLGKQVSDEAGELQGLHIHTQFM